MFGRRPRERRPRPSESMKVQPALNPATDKRLQKLRELESKIETLAQSIEEERTKLATDERRLKRLKSRYEKLRNDMR